MVTIRLEVPDSQLEAAIRLLEAHVAAARPLRADFDSLGGGERLAALIAAWLTELTHANSVDGVSPAGRTNDSYPAEENPIEAAIKRRGLVGWEGRIE